MHHLRWRFDNKLRFRSVDGHSIQVGIKADAPVVEKSKTTYADVWVGDSEIWYRLEELSITEKGELEVAKREIIVTGSFAAYQDYNTRPVGTNEASQPAWIPVIPTYGPSSSWEVNRLVLPWDNLWVRTLLTGALPQTYNGLPVHWDGAKECYQSYGVDQDHMLTPATPNATYMEASYVDGKPNSVLESNGWDNKPLRSFRDITWLDGHVTAFRTQEDTSQAARVIHPRLDLQCTLVSQDDQPCPVGFKKDARVLDYRLCNPVPLNSFPDKGCSARTYKFDGQFKSLAQLKTADEATPSGGSPAMAHAMPFWLFLLVGMMGAGGVSVILRKR